MARSTSSLNHVTVHVSRIAIIGDYNHHECGIRLSSVNATDNGTWRCDVIEYINRINIFASPKTVSHSFQVSIASNDELGN